MAGDWDVRGLDLDQRYAHFCTRPLTDQEVWNIGKAGIVCPSPEEIGSKLFLTSRSATLVWAEEIRDWATALGEEVSKAMYRPRGAKRRVQYSRIDSDSVRRQAALDGVALAMFGIRGIPTLYERRVKFHCDERAYRKIRDFVGGVAVNLIANFRFALEWAWGYSRSREFDDLFDALGHGDFQTRGNVNREEEETSTNYRLKRSDGHWRATPAPSHDQVLDYEHEQPHVINDRGFFDERYEARMRAEALEAESTHGTETPVEHETRGAEITPHPKRGTGRRETHQPAGARVQRPNRHKPTLRLR